MLLQTEGKQGSEEAILINLIRVLVFVFFSFFFFFTFHAIDLSFIMKCFKADGPPIGKVCSLYSD